MSAPTPTPTSRWTGLLAAALAHDINNLALSLASAQGLIATVAGATSEAADWVSFVEADVDRLRKLGARLRAVASAAETSAAARLDDACADALTDVDPAGRQVRRTGAPAVGARVRGTDVAVRVAITALLEHALTASPTGAPIQLAVRDAPGGSIVVEITAPDASAIALVERARLDGLLGTVLRDLRGNFSLVLAGAIADALGGAVYFASDPTNGLVLELRLVASPPEGG